jgi:RND family efflux transporter MFP subunit
MNMNKKDILTVFTTAFIGTVVFMWISSESETVSAKDMDSQQIETVAVEVANPDSKSIARHVPYLGTIAGSEDGNLSFRIQGMLNTILVEEGEKVRQDQLLATVSVPELDAQLKRVKSEFEKAKSSKNFWTREVSTDSSLYEEGAIAQTVFNKTAFNYEQALSGYYAARAALEEVRKRRDLTELRAPADGIVGSIMVREGSNVGPNQPVMFLQKGEPIVYADVLEQDIQKGIKIGTPVTAEWNNGEIIQGKVERIDFQAKPPFRSVRVFTSFPDVSFESSPSGAGISLQFEIDKENDALLVPVSAIDLRGESPRIFRVNDQMLVESVPVELGIQSGDMRQVKGRISPSDRIISSGVNNVEGGERVEIVREITPKS